MLFVREAAPILREAGQQLKERPQEMVVCNLRRNHVRAARPQWLIRVCTEEALRRPRPGRRAPLAGWMVAVTSFSIWGTFVQHQLRGQQTTH